MDSIKKLGLAELKLLAHPLRQRILRAFAGGEQLSVQEIATQLGLPHGKVYYHVQRLAQAGLLVQTGERNINGIIERLYQPAAESFLTVDEELRGLPGYERFSRAVADQAFSEVVRVYKEFQEARAEAARAKRAWPKLSIGFSRAWMTREEQAEVLAQIDKLLKPYSAAVRSRKGDEPGDAGRKRGREGDGRRRPGARPVEIVWLWFTDLKEPADQD
ncbi:MAG: helix-turn-helix transcriptional regulator [Limnochordaceae bacterium]|nr:helix-turn-helix transcriptional regulator [Limnochordaceae bacterium]